MIKSNGKVVIRLELVKFDGDHYQLIWENFITN